MLYHLLGAFNELLEIMLFLEVMVVDKGWAVHITLLTFALFCYMVVYNSTWFDFINIYLQCFS